MARVVAQPIPPGAWDAARYPRFGEVQGTEFTLTEGDLLLLPAHWWHAVTMFQDLPGLSPFQPLPASTVKVPQSMGR